MALGGADDGCVVECSRCKTQLLITLYDSNIKSGEDCFEGSVLGQGDEGVVESLFRRLQEALVTGRMEETGPQGKLENDQDNEEDDEDYSSSFVMLDHSDVVGEQGDVAGRPTTGGSQENGGHSDEVVHRALLLCSSILGIDFPLCEDCTKDVEERLRGDIDGVVMETMAYERLLSESHRIQDTAVGNGRRDEIHESNERSQEEILNEELAMWQEKIENVQLELKNNVVEELRRVESIDKELAQIEEAYWHAFNALILSLHEAADLRDVLQLHMERSENEMEMLRQTNVLVDLFKISADGAFGTISGLRLGSIPESPVQWWEINAAWGQSVMLLDIIAKSLGMRFDSGSIVWEPYGSFPRVLEEGKGVCELYGPVNKILCIGFDRSQTLFVKCLKDVEVELCRRGVTRDGKAFQLKYPIEADRVGGYSIRYGLARDKAWTKALRYMLIDLNQCLLGTLEYMDARAVANITKPLSWETK